MMAMDMMGGCEAERMSAIDFSCRWVSPNPEAQAPRPPGRMTSPESGSDQDIVVGVCDHCDRNVAAADVATTTATAERNQNQGRLNNYTLVIEKRLLPLLWLPLLLAALFAVSAFEASWLA